jgi:hypothetical protein
MLFQHYFGIDLLILGGARPAQIGFREVWARSLIYSVDLPPQSLQLVESLQLPACIGVTPQLPVQCAQLIMGSGIKRIQASSGEEMLQRLFRLSHLDPGCAQLLVRMGVIGLK